MSEQDNLAIVRRGYEAFGRGDIDELLSLLNEEIDWFSPGPSDLPTAGHRRGHQQVRQFFGSVKELFDFERFEPQTFIADGDTVVVLGEDSVIVKGTGKNVTESWAHVFTVKDDKIVRFQEYIDTAAIVGELRAVQART